MRTIALQAIMRQPALLPDRHGRDGRSRRSSGGRSGCARTGCRGGTSSGRSGSQHLLPEPTAVEERGFAAAERLVTVYDPATPDPVAGVAGAGRHAGRDCRAGRRPALLLGLLVFARAAGRGRADRHRVAVPLPARSADQRPGGRRAGDAARPDPRASAPSHRPGAAEPAGHDPGGAGLVRRRPSVWYDVRADVMPLLLLVFGAIVLRVAFFTSAPPFLNPDSAGYYVPGRNLVYGDGFDLGLRRTPTYPLFVAAVVSFVGEDLQTLVTVQHFLFGPLLVALTYLLGPAGGLQAGGDRGGGAGRDLGAAPALRALRHDRGAVRDPAAGAAERDRPGDPPREPGLGGAGRPAVRGAGALPAVRADPGADRRRDAAAADAGGVVAPAAGGRGAGRLRAGRGRAVDGVQPADPGRLHHRRQRPVPAGAHPQDGPRRLHVPDAPPGVVEGETQGGGAQDRAGRGGPQAAGLGGPAVPRRAWPVRRRGVPADAERSPSRRSATGRATS